MIKIKIFLIGILFLGLIFSNVAIAEPSIGTVTINPSEPILKSDVTLKAVITDMQQDVSSVTLWVKECDENTGLCDEPFSVEMTSTAVENEYIADFTLKFNSATFFDYWFDVTSGSNTTTIKDDSYTVEYGTESSNGGDNGGSDNTDENGSPGFELISLLIAMFAAIILYKKKR